MPSPGDLILSQGFNYHLYGDDAAQISICSPDLSGEGQTRLFKRTVAGRTLLACLYGVSESAWQKEARLSFSSFSGVFFLPKYQALCFFLFRNLGILDSFLFPRLQSVITSCQSY